MRATKLNLFRSHGFTLIEIMVVVITLGVIASLALTNFNKVVEQSYCRTAQINLIRIFNATEIYQLKKGTYALSGSNLTAINNDLKINITDTKFTYNYFTSNPATFYSANATRLGGPFYYCTVIKSPGVTGVSSTNPSCSDANYCSSIIP